jgi:hypothetical protein
MLSYGHHGANHQKGEATIVTIAIFYNKAIKKGDETCRFLLLPCNTST